MNICGILVHARPAHAASVRADMDAMPGVEIHEETPEGRFVVTVEDLPGVDVAETVLALHRLPGVLTASLVYHHFEPDPENEDAPVKA